MDSGNNGSLAFELSKSDLENVLRRQLGPHLKIESFTATPLTKPGDNYGSTILAVDVICEHNSCDSAKNLPLVVKLMPPSEFLREAFRIPIIFSKEARTYVLVAPEHRLLQQENGISANEMTELYPRFYGARTNLQDNLFEPADDGAILILENLTKSGYRVGDRRKGLNLEHVKLTVTSLARFHALTIGLKIHKPEIFKETVLKTCEKYSLGNTFDLEKLTSNTLNFIENIPECKPYKEQVEQTIKEAINIEFVLSPPPAEPFATMLHNDFWVNNMLFKYPSSDSDHPTEMKFVDFQIVKYDSPVRDLLFFLFTSSENGLLEKHFDSLISLYHKEFIGFLTKLQCNVDDFQYENFQRELDIYAPREFSHMLFLLNIVSAETAGAPSLSESSMDMFASDGGEVYTQKVKTLILTYAKKGWLNLVSNSCTD